MGDTARPARPGYHDDVPYGRSRAPAGDDEQVTGLEGRPHGAAVHHAQAIEWSQSQGGEEEGDTRAQPQSAPRETGHAQRTCSASTTTENLLESPARSLPAASGRPTANESRVRAPFSRRTGSVLRPDIGPS